jgi:hypothetical protein
MFSVDAPKQDAGDPESLQDLIRVVVAADDSSSVEHSILLATRLPVGIPVTATFQNDYWNITVAPQEQSVAFTTHDGQPLLKLQLQGNGPCTLTVDVAPGVRAPPKCRDVRLMW